jgi:formate hydrogenlyase subunit 3/multisubunit Na+/H+ antiporter MnhD subunit
MTRIDVLQDGEGVVRQDRRRAVDGQQIKADTLVVDAHEAHGESLGLLALQSGLVVLVIIAVINSAIAAYYYLRVIVVMYMREAREEAPRLPMPFPLGLSLALSLIATLYLGLLPGRVLDYAIQGARALLR